MSDSEGPTSDEEGTGDGLAKRAEYVIARLEGASDKKAYRRAGYRCSPLKRILSALRERHTIEHAPRSGRPSIFTESVMAAALDLLLEHEYDRMKGSGLCQLVVDEGWLKEPVDRQNFTAHFISYLKGLGYHPRTNAHNTIFFLKACDMPQRVDFCTSAQDELTHAAIVNFFWVDETTVEECPHPKGEPCGGHVCTAKAHVGTVVARTAQYSVRGSITPKTCA